MQKNCANCKNSYIKDGCYLICEIDGIQNDVVENCENFEVDPDLQKEVAEDLCSTCNVAERMRKMICLVSNGMMSYANYTYEAMAEVYEEQIDKLAEEKCKDYKQALREIKSIAQNLYYQSIKDPVRREKATYDIIEKVNGILEE